MSNLLLRQNWSPIVLNLMYSALCGFNYRLNNFYTLEDPPFVRAMGDFLIECLMRARRPNIIQAISYSTNAKYEEDIKVMHKVCIFRCFLIAVI